MTSDSVAITVEMIVVMTSDDWNECRKNLFYCPGNSLRHKMDANKGFFLEDRPRIRPVILPLRCSGSSHSTAPSGD
jgi:hypothetical protein